MALDGRKMRITATRVPEFGAAHYTLFVWSTSRVALTMVVAACKGDGALPRRSEEKRGRFRSSFVKEEGGSVLIIDFRNKKLRMGEEIGE